jgi:hypothetical protein
LYRVNPRRGELAYTNIQFNNIFDNQAAHCDLNIAYTVSWQTGVRRMAAWLDAHGGVAKADTDPFDDRLISAWEKSGLALAKEKIE